MAEPTCEWCGGASTHLCDGLLVYADSGDTIVTCDSPMCSDCAKSNWTSLPDPGGTFETIDWCPLCVENREKGVLLLNTVAPARYKLQREEAAKACLVQKRRAAMRAVPADGGGDV